MNVKPNLPSKGNKAFNFVNMEKEVEMFMFLYFSDNQSLGYYFSIYLFMGGSRNEMTSDNKQMRKKIQPCSLINNITQTASKHNKGNVKKYIYIRGNARGNIKTTAKTLFREHVDDFKYCSLLCVTLNNTLIGSH